MVSLSWDSVGTAGELFRIGEEMPPLALQQVDDIQVFRLRFGHRPLRRQEMHMGVAAEEALAFMSIQRLSFSFKSCCPGSISTHVLSGSYS